MALADDQQFVSLVQAYQTACTAVTTAAAATLAASQAHAKTDATLAAAADAENTAIAAQASAHQALFAYASTSYLAVVEANIVAEQAPPAQNVVTPPA